MSLTELELMWAVVKHAIPAAEAAWAAGKPLIDTEKSDVLAAVAALEKSFVDFKAAIPVVEAAVKAAITS